MDQKLFHILHRLEKSKSELLAMLSDMAPEKLNHKLDTHTWSIVQILDHLIIVEAKVVGHLVKKLDLNPPLKGPSFWSWSRFELLRGLMRLPIKYDSKRLWVEPSNQMTYQEVLDKWESTRRRIQGQLNGLTSEQLNAQVCRNLTGRINVYQQLSFLEAHLLRHRRQVRTIVKALDYHEAK